MRPRARKNIVMCLYRILWNHVFSNFRAWFYVKKYHFVFPVVSKNIILYFCVVSNFRGINKYKNISRGCNFVVSYYPFLDFFDMRIRVRVSTKTSTDEIYRKLIILQHFIFLTNKQNN